MAAHLFTTTEKSTKSTTTNDYRRSPTVEESTLRTTTMVTEHSSIGTTLTVQSTTTMSKDYATEKHNNSGKTIP
jgi:hypothetical protein